MVMNVRCRRVGIIFTFGRAHRKGVFWKEIVLSSGRSQPTGRSDLRTWVGNLKSLSLAHSFTRCVY